MKPIIGTEIYLSDDFSALWIAALLRLPDEFFERFDVIVFDNNPPGREESERVRAKCEENGFVYHRNAPGSHTCDALDQLSRYAHYYKHEYYIHVDIDCPILDANHVYQLTNAIRNPAVGAAGASVDAPYFTIFRTSLVFDFSAAYFPVYAGMTNTPHKRMAETTGGIFDHARFLMHRIIESGYRVEQLDIPVLHAACPSLYEPESQRARIVGDEERRVLQSRHEAFWADERVQKIMNNE